MMFKLVGLSPSFQCNIRRCDVFLLQNLNVSLRKFTLQVDERLLFKLLQFFGWVYNDDDVTVNQDSENLGIETHRWDSLF
jgi:hypothetical protein